MAKPVIDTWILSPLKIDVETGLLDTSCQTVKHLGISMAYLENEE